MSKHQGIRALTTVVTKNVIQISTSYLVAYAFESLIPAPVRGLARFGYIMGLSAISMVASEKITNEAMVIIEAQMLQIDLLMEMAKEEAEKRDL